MNVGKDALVPEMPSSLDRLNWNGVLAHLGAPGGHDTLELAEGEFRASATGEVFPFREGVPHFIDNVANQAIAAHFDETAKRFGNAPKAVEVVPSIASSLRAELAAKIDRRGRGQAVVDIGCGHGRFSAGLTDDHTVFGVDVSHQMLKLTDGIGIFPLLADGMRLPFTSGSIDCAYTIEVVQLFDDPRPILKEMARILKPGGLLVVSTLHRGSLLRRANRLLKGKSPDEGTRLRWASDVVAMTEGLPVQLAEVCWVMGPTSLRMRTRKPTWPMAPFASNVMVAFLRDPEPS